jgi:hypothetical protein
MSYPPTSPYYLSEIVNNQFLDVMINRNIPGDPTDVFYAIEPVYNLRPDLLASDLYGDSRLWWVFAQRNPNTLKDPLFNFVTGTRIYIPKIETLQAALGI